MIKQKQKKERIDWKGRYQALRNMCADDQITIKKLLTDWKYTIRMWEYTLNFDIVASIAFFIGGLLLGLLIAT